MTALGVTVGIGVCGSGLLLYLYFLFGTEKGFFTRTRQEVADIIESFINNTDGPRDWDDFVTSPMDDPEMEEIRLRCFRLPQEFPSEERGKYCGPDGVKVLRSYVATLRSIGR